MIKTCTVYNVHKTLLLNYFVINEFLLLPYTNDCNLYYNRFLEIMPFRKYEKMFLLK